MQRKRCMAAAVVELNSLPDAIGPAAQNNDFFLFGRRRLVFVLVGRIQIWREALELRGASIHAFVDWHHAMLFAQMSDFLLTFKTPNRGQSPVRESHAFGLAQHFGGNRLD